MKKKNAPIEILYVEDDPDVAHVYIEIIEDAFHNVKLNHFLDGRKAIANLEKFPTKYSLILSDFNLPGLNGGEIFKFVHRQMLGIPFIVLSGFDVSDDENLNSLTHSHVRNAVLVKPVVYKELVEKIKWCLESKKDLERVYMNEAEDHDEVSPVPSSLFLRVNEVSFDVYLKMNKNEKLIKVISSGDIFSRQLIKKFIMKGVNELFIKRSSIPNLVSLVSDAFVFNLKTQKKNLDFGKKQQYFNKGINLIVDGLLKSGFSRSIYNLSKEVVELNCEVIKDLVNNKKGLSKFFETYQISNRSYLDHIHLVTFISVSILHEIGWDSESTVNRISFACLLHDASLTAYPNILKKMEDEEEFNKEELEIYKNHPVESAEIAAKFESFVPNIRNLILEHHEDANSEGFPSGKSSLKVHPMSAILAIANKFTGKLHNKEINKETTFSSFLEVKKTNYRGHYRKALDALENIISK